MVERWNEDIQIDDGEFTAAMNKYKYSGDQSVAITSYNRVSLVDFLLYSMVKQQTEINELRAMIEAMQVGK